MRVFSCFFPQCKWLNDRMYCLLFFQENVVNADAAQSVEETKMKEAAVEPEIDWKVGDFCRSIYSEDGEEYEGVINISKL